MSDDLLIRCENVSKIFCRDLKKSLWYGVKDIADDLVYRKKTFPKSSSGVQLREGEFWANRDISFDVRRGECLGLIGRNGAGKTTLLKMLNGLIKPDAGTIELSGRVGALIALGAGFNPLLSGRENIFVNGSVLGLSRREILSELDEIIDFAEIEEFIDAPVMSYSSGMKVRLGFSIAAVLQKPDVLLLDEVFAVGDVGFRLKCLNAVSAMLKHAAVIFVSHDAIQIGQICDRVIALKNGEHWFSGNDVGAAMIRYEQDVVSDDGVDIYGGDQISVQGAVVTLDEVLKIELEIEVFREQVNLEPHICVFLPKAGAVMQINCRDIDRLKIGKSKIRIQGEMPQLKSANYLLEILFKNKGSNSSAGIVARCRGKFRLEIRQDVGFEYATTVVSADKLELIEC